MANFGIGIGAFAEGFTNGISLGEKLGKIRKANQAEKVQREALEAARAEREAAIDAEAAKLSGIETSTDAPPAPTAGADATQPVQPVAPEAPKTAAVDATATPTQALQSSTPTTAAASTATPMAAGGLPKIPAQPSAPATGTKPASTAASADATLAPSTTASVLGVSGSRMTRDQARAVAEKKAPSVMEFFQKKGVPRIAEMYIAQGDVEKAEAWNKWAEGAKSKRTMAKWAKAWTASQRGDMEATADGVFDLYKDLDDGITPMSKESVKDKDGNVTGFNVKLRNDETGEERVQFVDRSTLLEMGMSALAPPQIFEAAYKREEDARKAKAEAEAKAGEIRMKTAGEIAVEQARQGGRVELAGINHGYTMAREQQQHGFNLQRDNNQSLNKDNELGETGKRIQDLRAAGISDETIERILTASADGGAYKKPTSPEETRRLLFSDRMKNDPTFARKTPDQQRAIVEQDMSMVYSTTGGATPAASTPATPASAASPASRGLPVLDTKTGQIVYR